MAQSHFWNSALLYIYRPNLINRRYIGVQVISSWHLDENTNISSFEEKSLWESTTIDELQNRFNFSPRNGTIEEGDLVHNSRPILLLRKLFPKQSIKTLKKNATDSPSQSNNSEFDMIILFPALNYFALISICFDEESRNICLKLSDSFSYVIGLDEKVKDGNDDQTDHQLFLRYLFGLSSNYWLENILKPKLQQWMLSALEPTSGNNTFQGSIKMISVESYCVNYNRLKAKYSVPLLDIWSKVEKTDPLKFIFEDIAISAYLITLWQEEQQKLGIADLQTFIDIGCGNGLLVHILASEGYTGYGVDLRKRNIWDHYGSHVNLIEMRIDPFNEENLSTLPKCDWMIGNHSDELTPWIIFMASCASTTTRAFILPCCPFDFHGNKFQRTKDTDKSQYQCYINYLEQLSEQFGFKCFRDRLRIPSTKRICLICHGRNYVDANGDGSFAEQNQQIDALEEQMKEKRKAIVRERLQIGTTLRLREKEETVRNCTKIDHGIKEKIIARLTTELVHIESGKLTFEQAIALLDAELRRNMKKQCGGLQTFIRNHRHIFTIVNSRIQFQTLEQLRAKPERAKNKECWFFRHHPSGCPLSKDECAYKH